MSSNINKYLKYKNKYINLLNNMRGGTHADNIHFYTKCIQNNPLFTQATKTYILETIINQHRENTLYNIICYIIDYLHTQEYNSIERAFIGLDEDVRATLNEYINITKVPHDIIVTMNTVLQADRTQFITKLSIMILLYNYLSAEEQTITLQNLNIYNDEFDTTKINMSPSHSAASQPRQAAAPRPVPRPRQAAAYQSVDYPLPPLPSASEYETDDSSLPLPHPPSFINAYDYSSLPPPMFAAPHVPMVPVAPHKPIFTASHVPMVPVSQARTNLMGQIRDRPPVSTLRSAAQRGPTIQREPTTQQERLLAGLNTRMAAVRKGVEGQSDVSDDEWERKYYNYMKGGYYYN